MANKKFINPLFYICHTVILLLFCHSVHYQFFISSDCIQELELELKSIKMYICMDYVSCFAFIEVLPSRTVNIHVERRASPQSDEVRMLAIFL